MVTDAYENARFLCDQYYLVSPELEIEEHNQIPGESLPIRTVYVPSHLYHMLFELFKNSMRAVVEHHDQDKCDKLPALKVLIVRGKEDICVKVGTPKNKKRKVFFKTLIEISFFFYFHT